jgi:hypothetical protein
LNHTAKKIDDMHLIESKLGIRVTRLGILQIDDKMYYERQFYHAEVCTQYRGMDSAAPCAGALRKK